MGVGEGFGSVLVASPDFVVPRGATDLDFAANSRSFASLRMTIKKETARFYVRGADECVRPYASD